MSAPSAIMSESLPTDNSTVEGKEMDDILNDNGIITKGQIIIHISMFYIHFSFWGHVVLSFFTGYNPPWRCTGNRNNSSEFCRTNYNRTFTNEDDFFDKRCSLNTSEWTYTTHRTFSFVTEYNMVCSKAATSALTCALFHIGCVIGALLIGGISDTYGRKIVIVMATLTLPVPTIASAFIQAIWQLGALNFFRGVATSGGIYIGYVYLSELTPPKVRTTSANICLCFGSLGFLVLALLGYLANGWRYLSVYMGVMVLPLWLALLYIPESPRWLLSKGRDEEALMALKKVLAITDDVKISSKSENTQNQESMKIYSHLDLLKNRSLLKLTATLVAIWFVAPIMYYTVTKESTTVGGNLYVGFVLSVLADFPALFVVMSISRGLGRKVLGTGSCFVTGILVGCMALIPKTLSWRHTIMMVLTVTAKVTADSVLLGLWLWSSELYPTVVRSLGVSVCAIAEKLGMICVPFVSLLQVYSYRLPFILICVAGLLVGVAGLTLPETKGRPTRESVEDMVVGVKGKKKVAGVDNPVVVTEV